MVEGVPKIVFTTITDVAKEYSGLFGDPEVRTGKIWYVIDKNVNNKLNKAYGQINTCNIMESFKKEIVQAVKKELDIDSRALKFIALAKEILFAFDYINPYNIKKSSFVSPNKEEEYIKIAPNRAFILLEDVKKRTSSKQKLKRKRQINENEEKYENFLDKKSRNTNSNNRVKTSSDDASYIPFKSEKFKNLKKMLDENFSKIVLKYWENKRKKAPQKQTSDQDSGNARLSVTASPEHKKVVVKNGKKNFPEVLPGSSNELISENICGNKRTFANNNLYKREESLGTARHESFEHESELLSQKYRSVIKGRGIPPYSQNNAQQNVSESEESGNESASSVSLKEEKEKEMFSTDDEPDFLGFDDTDENSPTVAHKIGLLKLLSYSKSSNPYGVSNINNLYIDHELKTKDFVDLYTSENTAERIDREIDKMLRSDVRNDSGEQNPHKINEPPKNGSGGCYHTNCYNKSLCDFIREQEQLKMMAIYSVHQKIIEVEREKFKAIQQVLISLQNSSESKKKKKK